MDTWTTQTASAADFQARQEVLELVQAMVRHVDGTIGFWPSGMERLYGFSCVEAVGKRAHELLKTEFPQPLRDIETSFLMKGEWAGEIVNRRNDGTRIVIRTQWTLSRSDSAAAVIELHNNITDLKLAEQDLSAREAHLKSILETVPDAMVVIDEHGIIAVVQRRCRTSIRLYRGRGRRQQCQRC